MKIAACPRLARRPEVGTWYRTFDPKFAGTPLGTAHTLKVPSRFSPGRMATAPFEILYLSQNHLVCLREVEALLGPPDRAPLANPGQPWLIINVRVQLQQVADLTTLTSQRQLATSVQELTGDWRGYQTRTAASPVPRPTGVAPTQGLGAALFAVLGLEGCFTVSAKTPDQLNLIVFPAKLLKGSQLRYHDTATGQDHTIEGKARDRRQPRTHSARRAQRPLEPWPTRRSSACWWTWPAARRNPSRAAPASPTTNTSPRPACWPTNNADHDTFKGLVSPTHR